MGRYVKGIVLDCDPRFNLDWFGDPFRIDTLMIRRNQNPGKGLLDFLGGSVEDGESDIEAMERESYEELGLRAQWEFLERKRFKYKGNSVITFFVANSNTLSGSVSLNREELMEVPHLYRRIRNINWEEIAFQPNREVLMELFANVKCGIDSWLRTNTGYYDR